MSRVKRSILLLGAACVATALTAASASAAAGLVTGFADHRYLSFDAQERQLAFDRTVDAKAGLTMAFVSWRGMTSGVPVSPSDPADPAYSFTSLDGMVRDASARGLQVILASSSAPSFAEGPGRAATAPAGTWRPDPAAYAAFSEALARRYSGSFVPPGAAAPLPRVRGFQAWTEPNLSGHLSPQYTGNVAESPGIYRQLLNAHFAGVKSVHSDNVVVTAGAAPYGDPPGGERIRPLAFWRDVLCLQQNLGATACPVEPRFDVFAHNAITTSGGPRTKAIHPDDVATPDFGKLRRAVRAAERNGTADGGRHPLWATELWWESNPPDANDGVPLRKQANYIQEAMYILWRQGAEVVVNLALQDTATDPSNTLGESATGVLFESGAPKPSFTAFRFPFVTERSSKKRLRAWGKAPASGRLTIERKAKGGWQRVKRLNVGEGDVFFTRVKLSGKQRLRARVAGETSLTWVQR